MGAPSARGPGSLGGPSRSRDMVEVRTSYLELVAGRIHAIDGACVATHYLALFGFPLFPQRSLYLEHEVQEHRRQMSHTGQPLRLVWASVVLGYLRVWLGWAAFTSPFWLMWGERVDFSRPEWWVTGALFVLWLLVLFVPGRLSAKRKSELRLLGASTGIAVEPRHLGSFDLEGRFEDLVSALEHRGLAAEPSALDRALATADAHTARLVFAYAKYAAAHQGHSPELSTLAERALARQSSS